MVGGNRQYACMFMSSGAQGSGEKYTVNTAQREGVGGTALKRAAIEGLSNKTTLRLA